MFLLTMSLAVQFVFAAQISDESSTTLKVKGIVRCDTNSENYGKQWIDGRGSEINYIPTIGENGNCLSPDPDNSMNNETCCPSSMTCTRSGQGTSSGKEKGICNYTVANSCLDLRTQSECNSYTRGLAEYYYNKIINKECYSTSDLWFETTKYCWNESSCSCMWNGSSCIGALNYVKKCGDAIEGVRYGICKNPIISVTDTCDSDGFITYEIGAIWEQISGPNEPAPDCVEPEPSRVACGSVAKLEFFSMFNFISVMISLMMIYSYVIKKEKNKKKK